jgi:hypothetical protein
VIRENAGDYSYFLMPAEISILEKVPWAAEKNVYCAVVE